MPLLKQTNVTTEMVRMQSTVGTVSEGRVQETSGCRLPKAEQGMHTGPRKRDLMHS